LIGRFGFRTVSSSGLSGFVGSQNSFVAAPRARAGAKRSTGGNTSLQRARAGEIVSERLAHPAMSSAGFIGAVTLPQAFAR
jgi:hypothetical protein